MDEKSDSDLVGVGEVCALLELSRGALHARRRQSDFPRPVAELASGPVWERGQLVAYARARSARLVERPGVQALAGGGPGDGLGGRGGAPVGGRDWYSAVDVARLAGVSVDRVVSLAAVLPCRLALGGLPRIHRDDLPAWLARLAPQRVERDSAAPWERGRDWPWSPGPVTVR